MYIRHDELKNQNEQQTTLDKQQMPGSQNVQQTPSNMKQTSGYQMGNTCPFAKTCPMVNGNINMPNYNDEAETGMMTRQYHHMQQPYKYHPHHPHHPYHPYHPYDEYDHLYYHPYYWQLYNPYNLAPWLLDQLFSSNRY